jgi:hypothetical protein
MCTLPCAAQSGLKTINPPGGGKIMYGQVDGQTTEAGAMGYILRNLHNSIGAKPQVGKLFDVRGTNSVATFFTIARRDQGSGKPPLQVAGLLIAAKVSTDHVEAVLVSDDASRFNKTLPSMMKTLMTQWHPLAGATGSSNIGGGQSGDSGKVAPLKTFVARDHSASVDLPDGWQVGPNQSGQGTIIASGPNSEVVSLDVTFGATDTNNRNAQQTMRMVQSGRLQGTAYANAFYYPYGADPAKTFVDILHHAQQKAGAQLVDYHITGESPAQSGPRMRCFHLEGTADFHDSKGTRELNSLYCVSPPGPASGVWLSYVFAYSAPLAVAQRERATLGAIVQSFRLNQGVVNAQAAQIAGPSIANSMRIGAAVKARVDAAHQAEDIHNSSVYQHWDSMDRRSQEFSNYQLGYSVISDSQGNAHGTLWNDDAAALVKADPNRFEYVSAPNYWKGIDY